MPGHRPRSPRRLLTGVAASLALGVLGTACSGGGSEDASEPSVSDVPSTLDKDGLSTEPPRKPKGGKAQSDFDGDGYPDTAVQLKGGAGAGLERAYGPLAVLYGGKDGLRPDGKPLVAGEGRKDDRGFLVEGYALPLAGSVEPGLGQDVQHHARDFDGDGYTDLVAEGYIDPDPNDGKSPHHIVLLRGGPKGLSGEAIRLRAPGNEEGAFLDLGAVGDFNGDRHPDLMVMRQDRSGPELEQTAQILYGPFDASGKVATFQALATGDVHTDRLLGKPLAADFDRDGRTDLLMVSDYDEEYEGEAPQTPVRYFRGTPEGPVHDAELTRSLTPRVATDQGSKVRAGMDLDDDGYPDILPPGQGKKTDRRYLRGGPDGIRAGTKPLTTGKDVGSPLLEADVTGDGEAELVSRIPHGTHRNRGAIQLAAKESGPRLSPSQTVHMDTPGVPGEVFAGGGFGKRDHFAEGLYVLDADQDGHADVLATEGFSGPKQRFGGLWLLRGGPDGLRTDDVRRFQLPELGHKR